MVHKKLRVLWLVISFFLFLENVSFAKSKTDLQKNFLSFTQKIMKVAKYIHEASGGFPDNDLYYNFPPEKLDKFKSIIDSNREVLAALQTYSDLYKVGKVGVMPPAYYKFIKANFAIPRTRVLTEKDYLVLLVSVGGGDFQKNSKTEKMITGFLDHLSNYDLGDWKPMRDFVGAFEHTMAVNQRLGAEMGNTILPLLKKYYTFMDLETRLNLFVNLFEEARSILSTPGFKLQHKILTARVFQSSGPLLIKMLQELQERIKGKTPITEVLAELKSCRPMPFANVREMVSGRVVSMIKDIAKRKHGIIEKPLGIASIGQTHKVRVNGIVCVVKLQKEGIKDLFHREYKFIQELIEADPEFDKGMKQWVENIKEGVVEELNFSFERKYIRMGDRLYTDLDKKIKGMTIPSFSEESEADESAEVLFMALAKGESADDIMERSVPEELLQLYDGVYRLYDKYLYAAWDKSLPFNFYHGDLHRGNIYYNLEDDFVTMIDFGNAGVIQPHVRDSLINMYKAVWESISKKGVEKDKAILRIGSILENFILSCLKDSDPVQEKLIKTYFSLAYNPKLSVSMKVIEADLLIAQQEEMKEKIKLLEPLVRSKKAKKSQLEELEILKNNRDFITALTANCLNGAANTLIQVLRGTGSVSLKLQDIFLELQRNGISMPKEAIFFNKSNKLLQGILENLEFILDKKLGEKEYEKKPFGKLLLKYIEPEKEAGVES